MIRRMKPIAFPKEKRGRRRSPELDALAVELQELAPGMAIPLPVPGSFAGLVSFRGYIVRRMKSRGLRLKTATTDTNELAISLARPK